MGRLTRSKPELRLLFQRFNEQTVIGVGNPTQSFHRSLGILAIAGEDSRGQPVFGKMVVSGAGLPPKSPQDTAPPIASPYGMWVKWQGWQEVGAHGWLIIIKN